MAIFKSILFFRHPRGGWSETYYQEAADSSAAFNNAFSLMQSRMRLAADPTDSIGIRSSEVDSQRVSSLVSTPNLHAVGPWSSTSDLISSAALCQLFNEDEAVQRPLYLAGNPDNAYDTFGGANPDQTQWDFRLGQYLAKLKDGSWYVRHSDKFEPGGAVDIVGWIASGTGPSTLVTTTTPHGLSTDDMVNFYRIKGLLPRPGRLRVVSVASATVFTVHYRTRVDYSYQQGGMLQPFIPRFAVIDSAGFSKWTHRDRGRPIDQSRGRRRTDRQ